MKIFLAFFLTVSLLASCSNFGKVLKSNDVEYKYKKAIEYFQKKKYNYVIQIFDERFFPMLKGTKEFEEAFYMLAYSHYYEKDYFNAENLFRQYSETFAQSTRAEEMYYMYCYTYYKQSPKVDLEQTNTKKAMAMMEQFLVKYPTSKKVKEANTIIENCQAKLEEKDFKAAQLYFHMGQFKAASVAFDNVLSSYPESNRGDEYKYMAIKAYYQYALNSIPEKQIERYEYIINQSNDFIDRFSESKYIKEIEKLISNSNTNIKNLKNEQTKTTTGS